MGAWGRRWAPVLVVGALALGGGPVGAASRIDPPGGEIWCGSSAEVELNAPLTLTPSTGVTRLRGTMTATSCTGHTLDQGGRGVIGNAQARLRLVLPAGSTCTAFVPGADYGKIRVAWRTAAPEARNVAKNRVRIASITFDGDALLLTSQPITRGAYTGSALVFRLLPDRSICDTTAFGATSIGADLSYLATEGTLPPA